MNPSSRNSKSLLLVLGAGLCLIALVATAAPVDPEEASELGNGRESGDGESAMNGESEFGDEARAASGQQEDGEDSAPASPISMADSQDEPRGLDSNIANAKVQMSAQDMATAAGHHYHGHGVSGKMEMGAHTEKKGAFGWHAKFPVGGKGRK